MGVEGPAGWRGVGVGDGQGLERSVRAAAVPWPWPLASSVITARGDEALEAALFGHPPLWKSPTLASHMQAPLLEGPGDPSTSQAPSATSVP